VLSDLANVSNMIKVKDLEQNQQTVRTESQQQQESQVRALEVDPQQPHSRSTSEKVTGVHEEDNMEYVLLEVPSVPK